jgi:AmmeMemoRadiSam system protein A
MVDDKERFSLDADERAVLLDLARRAVSAAAAGVCSPAVVLEGWEPQGGPLAPVRGGFVTLRAGGRLRGCIGTIEPSRPLWWSVVDCAISSACRDPRFPPVTAEEVDSVAVEISVLTPFRRVDGPESIVIGEHGLYLRRGADAGLLLPQVAVEYGWGPEEFLEQCCWKAGLPAGSWKDEETEIMIFSALVFGEGGDA